MAKKSMILKQQREPKYSTRAYTRCKICGRPHAYLRKFGICRICFRNLAYKGEIPGVKKSSWKKSLCSGAAARRPGGKPPALGRKSRPTGKNSGVGFNRRLAARKGSKKNVLA